MVLGGRILKQFAPREGELPHTRPFFLYRSETSNAREEPPEEKR
jgi:hypothetical protein